MLADLQPHWIIYFELLQSQSGLSASIKDKKNQVPLHHAAANKRTTLQVIEALLAAYSDGAESKDEYGRLPLHVALKGRASYDVLKSLLQSYPEAAKVKNKDSQLPIHYAAEYDSPLPFIKELLALYPQGACAKNNFQKLALHLSLDGKASNETPLELLLADLPTFHSKARDQVSGLSWTSIMDYPNISIERIKFLVRSVFEMFPSDVHQLAHAKDAKGREAISICHAEVRALMNEYLLFLKRFELQQGQPVHKSATSIVYYAWDFYSVKETPKRVALKFMKVKQQFLRELAARSVSELDGDYVLDILLSFDGDALGLDYQKNLDRTGLSDYRYCLVLPADRSLKEIIDKERIAGRDMEAVRNISAQMARALDHLHCRMRIHGDIKVMHS